jgi:predicted nucleic acid-binding Zn ribbon protein
MKNDAHWNRFRLFFCSDRCRNRYYSARHRQLYPRKKKPLTLANCIVCGENFKRKRSDAKTCSATCRQRSRRRRTVTDKK